MGSFSGFRGKEKFLAKRIHPAPAGLLLVLGAAIYIRAMQPISLIFAKPIKYPPFGS